jgi:hypothetical protein
MSLKALHLVFVAAAVLLAVFVGLWAVDRAGQGEGGYWALAGGCLAAVVGLSIYAVWFLRKLRDVSYL